MIIDYVFQSQSARIAAIVYGDDDIPSLCQALCAARELKPERRPAIPMDCQPARSDDRICSIPVTFAPVGDRPTPL